MARSDVYEFDFPWPKPPLSLNYRMHHMQAANIVKQVRCEIADRAAGLPVMERCRVELEWVVNTRAKRDDENPVPTLKALCDGLVDAGIVPDDTNEYMVKLMPFIRYQPKQDGAAHMVLRVTDIGGNS